MQNPTSHGPAKGDDNSVPGPGATANGANSSVEGDVVGSAESMALGGFNNTKNRDTGTGQSSGESTGTSNGQVTPASTDATAFVFDASHKRRRASVWLNEESRCKRPIDIINFLNAYSKQVRRTARIRPLPPPPHHQICRSCCD